MKKFLSAVLAASVAASSVGITPVFAEGTTTDVTVMVLGDSIASGYGLDAKKGEVNYGELLADYYGGKTANYAEPGATSADTLDQVKNFSEQQMKELANAKIVVISTGGNDMIKYAAASIIQFAQLNGLLAEGVTLDDIPANPSLESLQTYVNMDDLKAYAEDTKNAMKLRDRLNNIYYNIGFTDADEDGAKYDQIIAKQIIPNINETVSVIREANPDARIVLQNVYNPFQFEKNYEAQKLSEHSSSYRMPYALVKSTFDNVVKRFAAQTADLTNVEIADVYTDFTSLSEDEDGNKERFGWYFTNIQAGKKDFDFHPNQAGHVAIAASIINTLTGEECVNGNLLVKTHDALSNVADYPEVAKESYEKAIADVKEAPVTEPPKTTTTTIPTTTTAKPTTTTTTTTAKPTTTTTTTTAKPTTTTTTTTDKPTTTTTTTTEEPTTTTTTTTEPETTTTTETTTVTTELITTTTETTTEAPDTTTTGTCKLNIKISVASQPVKTVYEIGEELDLSGLTINGTATYTDIYGQVMEGDWFETPYEDIPYLVIDDSRFNNQKAGAYTIFARIENASEGDEETGIATASSNKVKIFVEVIEKAVETTEATTTTEMTTTTEATTTEATTTETTTTTTTEATTTKATLLTTSTTKPGGVKPGTETSPTTTKKPGVIGGSDETKTTDAAVTSTVTESEIAASTTTGSDIEVPVTTESGIETPETTTTDSEAPDTPSETEIVFGDVNNDGTVDSSDASNILIEYSTLQTGGTSTLTEAQFKAADVNEDDTIDSSDASMVLQFYSYVQTGGEITDMKAWKQDKYGIKEEETTSEEETASEEGSEETTEPSEDNAEQPAEKPSEAPEEATVEVTTAA